MPLVSNDTRDIEAYVAEQMFAPVFFPPFAAANVPLGTENRYKAIYILDTSRPAWMDINGAWRYADGSAI
jgi:hypothetical protein